jgi:pyruvate/oxaloacetate carboxyltransferase
VVRLAELALIAGAAAGVERIDAETVHAASSDMSWPTLETMAY